MPRKDLPARQVNISVGDGTRLGEGTAVAPSLPATEQDMRSGSGAPGTNLEVDLRLALEVPVTEFVLHYQPVVDLTSGNVVGVESLVRWQHPVLGLLGPDHFIALAEESGLIHQLGEWVLEQAVRDAAILTHEGRELDMAVNFSARQLNDHVVANVQRAFENSGVELGRLTVEVTESAFVKDEGITAATYEALSRMGVKFAIDDFGTSFS